MVGLLIFLILIISVFCYLIFAPFFIELNSVNGTFSFDFHTVLSINCFIKENSLFLDLRIMGWRKQIDLLAKKKRNTKSVRKKVSSKKPVIPLRKVNAIIKSFKINKFYLAICFDNMLINGIIYPLFAYLNNNNNRHIEVNFLNRNEIIIKVENNFYRIIRAYITS